VKPHAPACCRTATDPPTSTSNPAEVIGSRATRNAGSSRPASRDVSALPLSDAPIANSDEAESRPITVAARIRACRASSPRIPIRSSSPAPASGNSVTPIRTPLTPTPKLRSRDAISPGNRRRGPSRSIVWARSITKAR
jgi:hypothetical protein